MDDFKRPDFIAHVHQGGSVVVQDCPNGWRIALERDDIPAFIEWLRAAHSAGEKP